MEVRKDGAWRTINTAEAYVGGAWRTLKYVEGYIGGAWRTIASFIQPLTLAISPSPTGTFEDASTQTATASAVPTGGLGPFTYAWTLVSSTGLTGIDITAPSSATTGFTATTSGFTLGSAVFHCVCTDSLGSTATANVTANFQRVPGGGGA
jgi:hypothetical protein